MIKILSKNFFSVTSLSNLTEATLYRFLNLKLIQRILNKQMTVTYEFEARICTPFLGRSFTACYNKFKSISYPEIKLVTSYSLFHNFLLLPQIRSTRDTQLKSNLFYLFVSYFCVAHFQRVDMSTRVVKLLQSSSRNYTLMVFLLGMAHYISPFIFFRLLNLSQVNIIVCR